jgi:hypothetical protein
MVKIIIVVSVNKQLKNKKKVDMTVMITKPCRTEKKRYKA